MYTVGTIRNTVLGIMDTMDILAIMNMVMAFFYNRIEYLCHTTSASLRRSVQS